MHGGVTYAFGMRFAKSAFAPIPGAWLSTLPSGAWGSTTFAACEGLCSGWTELGESFGVDVVDMMKDNKRLAGERKQRQR